jgi:two-component system chemotaxis response regulator CheY
MVSIMNNGKKILIAEDSDVTQRVLKLMLSKHGYDVVAQCTNGKDAVTEYKKLKPDIVLMDLAMPKKDGVTAIKEIIEFDSNAKIIAVSALYRPQMRTDAMNAGAKEYIIKPFEVSELLNAIEKCLAC